MKRQIIKIDEEKCNGCGLCASACAEGAIQMVDGKARLVSEVFCDGLGACLGECPVGAISIEQREAAPYSERETMEKLIPQGLKTVTLHLEHLKNHGQRKFYEEGIAFLKEKGIEISESEPMSTHSNLKTSLGAKIMHETSNSEGCSCPHATQESMKQTLAAKSTSQTSGNKGTALTNWPIQLQLINPDSEVFDDADIVIAADCTAFALPDFYKRFTKNKVLIVFCTKLDHVAELYVEKLAAIFTRHSVRSITLLRMIVPCCGGTSMILHKALEQANKEIDVIEYTINFDGTMS